MTCTLDDEYRIPLLMQNETYFFSVYHDPVRRTKNVKYIHEKGLAVIFGGNLNRKVYTFIAGRFATVYSFVLFCI